jgi:peptidoglycan hydrolase-like protein with peptidoglycan-binding domain
MSFRRITVVGMAVLVSLCAWSGAAQASADLGHRALRSGAHGQDVRTLQRYLREAGISVRVDGQYGPSTVGAVKRFQRAANLSLSGVTGPQTVIALRRASMGGTAAQNGGFSADGTSGRMLSRSLGDRMPVRRGMKGHDIRVLQDLLGKVGIRVGVDGRFGGGTRRAVKRFERSKRRAVNGVMDAGDIATLRIAVERGAGAQEQPVTLEQPVAPPPGPGQAATVGPDGLAVAPAGAPPAVQAIIAAGNEIASKPYRYGGGHGKWRDSAYDCSGSVSYALHGANMLDASLDSTGFESWGRAGAGQWVTIYANGGHAYMIVAGLRFDTSGATSAGTRWQADLRSGRGYVVRHPEGL